MLKALVISRLQAMFAGMFGRSALRKKRGAGGKALFIILFIYVAACFFGMFGMLFSSMCGPFYESGLGWLYFSMTGILAFALCFIGSVFTAQQQLFTAKDNELLLSMPIPPFFILLSRMLSLLALNYLFSILVMLPSGVVWCMNAPVTAMGAVSFVLSFIFLPFLSLALSSLFGWALAWIESKLRKKNVVSIIFSLVFLAAYFYVYSRIQTYLNLLIANGETIGAAIRRAVPPAYHMGAAVADGSVVSLLLFILFCAAPIAIVMLLLSRNFIRITTSSRGTARVKYRGGELRASGVRKALFRKEMTHFLGNSTYLINAGLGVLFMLVVAVLLAFKNGTVTQMVEMVEGFGLSAALAACILYCLCASMVIVTAPSISLEAKTLWISRTIPVRSGYILLAKANTHIAFCIPFIVVSSAITAFAAEASLSEALLLFAAPFVITCFNAYFGLIVNLRFPKFDWISEVYAIKQGLSTLLAMFGSFAIMVVPILLYAFLLGKVVSVGVYVWICTAVFAALSLLMRGWLITKGAEKFDLL